MIRYRNVIMSSAILLFVGMSAVSVEGLPACERYVKSFVEKRVKNPVSRTTAMRWAEWGKSHPDFKPKPRPRTKLVKQEVVRKVDFACQVDAPNPDLVATLPPGPLPDMSIEPMPAMLITFEPPLPPTPTDVATSDAPPLVFVPPYTTGLTPPIISDVPEPSEFLLVLSGFVAAGLFWQVSRKHQDALALPSA